MEKESHFRRLEQMYLAAPVNRFYTPDISVNEGEAAISIHLSEKYHHAAQGVHGSVYFKMLDDAAFFAANSLEMDFFVLTVSFTTYLTRPVSEGIMRSVGKVLNRNRTQFICEAVVYDEKDRELGRGNGVFVRSKRLLADVPGYASMAP